MDNLGQRIRNIFEPVVIINGVEYGECPSKTWDKVPSQADVVEDAEIIEEFPDKKSEKPIRVERRIYQELAAELRDRIDGRDYISQEIVEVEDDDITYQLAISAMIYYRDISTPDGSWSEISDIIPVCCELRTFRGVDMDETKNDFEICKLKKELL